MFSAALAGGVSNVSFSELSSNLGRTMYEFKFRIPAYYTLLVRSLSVLEVRAGPAARARTSAPLRQCFDATCIARRQGAHLLVSLARRQVFACHSPAAAHSKRASCSGTPWLALRYQAPSACWKGACDGRLYSSLVTR